MSGTVMHFELPADDLARAQEFYQGIFGWTVTPFPGAEAAAAVTTPSDANGRPTNPGGINGGIATRAGAIRQPLVTLHVESIEQTLREIDAAGGKQVQGRTAVGNVGFVGYFADPEGNTVGLWEFA